MNASDRQLMALALKKQRLQFEGELIRQRMADGARGLAPLWWAADTAAAGGHWLRAHPEIAAVAVAALVALRPRRIWAWGRRAFVTWRLWRRGRDWLAANPFKFSPR